MSLETLNRHLLRIVAVPLSGAFLTLIALSSGGCGGESVTSVDPKSPDMKKSLMSKYPELANPPQPRAKKRGRR